MHNESSPGGCRGMRLRQQRLNVYAMALNASDIVCKLILK